MKASTTGKLKPTRARGTQSIESARGQHTQRAAPSRDARPMKPPIQASSRQISGPQITTRPRNAGQRVSNRPSPETRPWSGRHQTLERPRPDPAVSVSGPRNPGVHTSVGLAWSVGDTRTTAERQTDARPSTAVGRRAYHRRVGQRVLCPPCRSRHPRQSGPVAMHWDTARAHAAGPRCVPGQGEGVASDTARLPCCRSLPC